MTATAAATPAIVPRPREQDKKAPAGWGPGWGPGAASSPPDASAEKWLKEADIVLKRLRKKDQLTNDEFLLRYPELDINLTKTFSLGPEEMAEYVALVGEPMNLDLAERRLQHPGQFGGAFKNPQHFVNEVRM